MTSANALVCVAPICCPRYCVSGLQGYVDTTRTSCLGMLLLRSVVAVMLMQCVAKTSVAQVGMFPFNYVKEMCMSCVVDKSFKTHIPNNSQFVLYDFSIDDSTQHETRTT